MEIIMLLSYSLKSYGRIIVIIMIIIIRTITIIILIIIVITERALIL